MILFFLYRQLFTFRLAEGHKEATSGLSVHHMHSFTLHRQLFFMMRWHLKRRKDGNLEESPIMRMIFLLCFIILGCPNFPKKFHEVKTENAKEC